VKRLLAALLALSLSPAVANAGSSISQKIRAEQSRAQQLQWQLHQKRLQLSTATNRVTDLQGQLAQTNAAITQVNAHLDDLNTQADSTQRKLDWNTVQLQAAQTSLARHDAAFKRRLVAIYENGNLEYLNVLLSAHSFSEFIERWEDLQLLIASNERAVRERKAAAQRVAAVQADLESERIALQSQQEAQVRARTQLAGLADERRNLVAVADQQRRGTALQVAQMEDLTAAEEARLEDLIRERQRELAAEREAQRRAAGIAGVIPPAESGSPGALDWPLTGPITSPFGWRRSPFGGAPDFHPGLDIGVDTGTTVRAAAAGTVIMAQWYGGYGNYVLIDHGGGISTGYGHLSSIYVSVGQHVGRGDPIAASGNTGASTGPHLHFEVRKDGKPIDPSPWLH
jgi:murein DD-endopeptidase MepM/ murein hydrolase activator NlpD